MMKTMRLSAFCRMYACGSACTRGTTMWLSVTWRTFALTGAWLTAPSTSHTHGPAAWTIARTVVARSKRCAPPAIVAASVLERRAHLDVGAARARIERVDHDQPRVVDAGIGVREAPLETRLQAGTVAGSAEVDAERLRQRHPAAEMIIEEQSGADHPRRAQMRLVWKHEQQLLDDVWGCAQQHLALGERFADEPEFVVLEVAQSAVDQLRAPRRRMRSEIVLLDQQHGKPATRGVARDPCAVDAAADDQQVVRKRLHWRCEFYRMPSGRSSRQTRRRSRARSMRPTASATPSSPAIASPIARACATTFGSPA